MRVRRLTTVTTAALAAALIAMSGCGGGSGSPSSVATAPTRAASGTPAITTPARVTAQPGLLGGAPSAGTAVGYTPTGAIVGDSGFRPAVDGFGFENYGNDAGPVNLRPANVEHLFGNQVCAIGTGATCRLVPAAQQWMRQENDAMAGGHCMGFSVTALRFFAKELPVTRYGAKRTFALPVQGNVNLQSLIAENFAYQSLPAVTDRMVEGSPTKVLRALTAALKARTEQYTLGIFKADGTGGHAITPFAVEDKGAGRAKILVYDNNFPGVVRAVDVNTRRDTWRYVGGVNPSDTNERYAGDARTQSMSLLPTAPGEGRQPCPFCPKRPKADPTYPVPDRLKYIEVVLRGTSANHPHLVFKDAQGRRTGFAGGHFLKEIPGIKVVQTFSVRNWQDGAEPKFHLPIGHPQYTVTVDGTTLKRPLKTRITVNGNGVVFYIQDLQMIPGQQDALILPKGDLGLSYVSARKFPGSPTLGAQFPQFDLLGHRQGTPPKARLITMGTGWVGLQPGAPIALRLMPQNGTVEVASPGGRVLDPKQAFFVVSLDSTALTGGKSHSYFGPVRGVNVDGGQTLRFHYLRPTATTLPVDVLDTKGAKVRTAQVPQAR
jgi:hypothetical protein